MSTSTMKDIFDCDPILSDQEQQILDDYKALRSLEIFPSSDFKFIERYEQKHFHSWCVEVLAAHSVGLLDVKPDGEGLHKQRLLIYRFRQLLARGIYKAEDEEFPFDIDYSQHIWMDPDVGEENWMTPEEIECRNDGVYARMEAFRQNKLNPPAAQDLEDIKVGEDTGTTAAIIQTAPNTVEAILADPVNAIIPNRKYYGRKTKKAVRHTQRQHKAVQNARRMQTHQKPLVKGYNKMPHDCALKIPNSDQFAPTIFIDDVRASQLFEQDFPKSEREHGFMVSCKGQVLYWNTLIQDFGPELVALP